MREITIEEIDNGYIFRMDDSYTNKTLYVRKEKLIPVVTAFYSGEADGAVERAVTAAG